MSLLSEIEEDAKKYFNGPAGCHSWSHTERVRALCIRMGNEAGANLAVLEMAAILHDIGRKFEDDSNGAVCHAERGAELAAEILNRMGVDQKTAGMVLHCIECHRFRGNKIPRSLEAKILFDADKLDAIGAVGIGRAFLYCGEHGEKLREDIPCSDVDRHSVAYAVNREFLFKLSKIKDRMQTEVGRRIACERHEFMETFFKRLREEEAGEA